MSVSMKLAQNFCEDAKEAYTLPASYYTSSDVFAQEVKNIFLKDWICVAHLSEVSKPNDYVVREILNESIIILRGKDNVLRAFYNVCPHRGHRIFENYSKSNEKYENIITNGVENSDGALKGRAKNELVCAYHAWTFKHDGSLASARNCNNVHNFNKDEFYLSEIRCEEYCGFVFINLDSKTTKSVEDQLPGLKKKVLEAMPNIQSLTLGARFVTRTPANWKNIVDNYMECYHCEPSHPGFASSVCVDRYWNELYGNWTLQHAEAIPSDKSFKFDGDSHFWGFWLWPCTMWNVSPVKGVLTVIFEFPIDAETTLQNYEIYFSNENLAKENKDLILWYRDVFRPEDLRLVESVQKGLHSRGYKGQGRIMADKNNSGISEVAIAHFHSLVAKKYG